MLKNFFGIALVLVVALGLTLVSCSEDSLVDTSSDNLVSSNFEGADLSRSSDRNRCFELQFPVTFEFQDGSTQTFDSDSVLRAELRAYKEANPDAERPELVFPISVTLADGTSQDIMTEDAFDELRRSCRSDRRDGRRGKGRRGNDCFDIDFPVTFQFEDGSTQTFADDSTLRAELRAYREANPDAERPELVFPVSVTLADGTSQALNSEEDFEDLKESCRPDRDRRDRRDRDDDCFELQFPVSLSFPDGSTQEFMDRRELRSGVRAFKQANPEVEGEISLVFPVTIVFEDETTQVVNSEEELDAAEDTCEDEDDDE